MREYEMGIHYGNSAHLGNSIKHLEDSYKALHSQTSNIASTLNGMRVSRGSVDADHAGFTHARTALRGSLDAGATRDARNTPRPPRGAPTRPGRRRSLDFATQPEQETRSTPAASKKGWTDYLSFNYTY